MSANEPGCVECGGDDPRYCNRCHEAACDAAFEEGCESSDDPTFGPAVDVQRIRDWARDSLALGRITKEMHEAFVLCADDLEVTPHG